MVEPSQSQHDAHAHSRNVVLVLGLFLRDLPRVEKINSIGDTVNQSHHRCVAQIRILVIVGLQQIEEWGHKRLLRNWEALNGQRLSHLPVSEGSRGLNTSIRVSE